jgi:hypothetical protein
MVRRSTFPLRLDPKTMSALRTWADDELRSLNGQIEYLLRHALRDAGRLSTPSRTTGQAAPDAGGGATQADAQGGGHRSSAGAGVNRRELVAGARE